MVGNKSNFAALLYMSKSLFYPVRIVQIHLTRPEKGQKFCTKSCHLFHLGPVCMSVYHYRGIQQCYRISKALLISHSADLFCQLLLLMQRNLKFRLKYLVKYQVCVIALHQGKPMVWKLTTIITSMIRLCINTTLYKEKDGAT